MDTKQRLDYAQKMIRIHDEEGNKVGSVEWRTIRQILLLELRIEQLEKKVTEGGKC